MTWLDMSEQRDAAGNLTDLALALDALSDIGCDCGTDEDESCVGCLCETALKGIWEQLESAEAEVERLKAHTWQQERDAVINYLITDGQKSWPETKRFLEILAKDIEEGEHWPAKGEDHE